MKWRLLAVSCGILALGLLLYPLIGELLSERYHSDVETVYAAAIADADDAELTAQRVNWLSVPAPEGPLAVTAKTRYTQREAAATAEVLPDGRLRVTFAEPQRAVTAGQAVVLYVGEAVAGGGTIC